MKKLIANFRNRNQVQFSIKREVLYGGAIKLTPMVKMNGFMTAWVGITKVHGRYFPFVVNEDYSFTRYECLEYINGFKAQLEEDLKNSVVEITFEMSF